MLRDPRVPGWSFKKYTESSILGASSIFILALIAVLFFPGLLTGIFLLVSFLLWSVVIYFFRDPDRFITTNPHVFFSSGDGVVSDITNIGDEDLDYVRVGIFLSVFNVHVQRAPMAGEVDFVRHQIGKNYPAYDPAASLENDQIAMGIKTDYGMVIVKQISGILARKCINYASPGDHIQSGQRFGLIKFGSRVELYMPTDAKILCSVGDKVKGGLSVIAEMPGI
ncbi:MAG: phosphatidylserine decarboxylase family protein [Chloroflexi bacterium]|nr:phosphatidylserine decarboxylase family protein [Chloroflexota bacterium]